MFVSHDGSLVGRDARMAWPGGRAGRHTPARTVLLSGYTRESSVDAVPAVVLVFGTGLLSVGCAVAGLSRATRDRLALRLPGPAFAAYVKWRS
ncbi:hypothetical protein GCM10010415_65300 [Streptomyces atrovirens]|uniref:Uncharacterized protein n=1 Tax=Streptomyces atrovirens TaxID=285556 RepID=A0ABW0DQA1_9ACTN